MVRNRKCEDQKNTLPAGGGVARPGTTVVTCWGARVVYAGSQTGTSQHGLLASFTITQDAGMGPYDGHLRAGKPDS